MSQQEFFQGQQPLEDDEINYPPQPYYWSTKPHTAGAPKDEPASSHDEPMVQDDYQSDYQSGYTAQDTLTHTYQQSDANHTVRAGFFAPRQEDSGVTSQGQTSWSQKQKFSPDGDSFEHQYRPHAANNRQWNVPPWARPQRQKGNPARLFWIVLLGLIFINPLLHILGALLAVAGVLIFALFLAFLFFILLGIPYLFFRAVIGRPSPWRRWRGPWGW